MGTARQHKLISVDDYLIGEQASDVKHEFVGGVVYAMVGATVAHNIIATNLISILRNQLISPCREFSSDMKVRIRTSSGTRFYYPDAQVVCHSNPQSDTFQDSPVLMFEVISESTRRADEGEKKDSYLTIPSLQAYILLEQEVPAVVVYFRVESGFERLVFDGRDSIIEISEPAVELEFGEIYRDIQFAGASG